MTRAATVPGAALVAPLVEAANASAALAERACEDLLAVAEAAKARDDAALEAATRTAAETEHELAEVGRRREAARAAVARVLGRPAEEVTLTALAAVLPAAEAEAVRRCRDRARRAAEALRDRHLRTAVLLAEFAKANRNVLRDLLPRPTEARTYGTDGSTGAGPAAGLVDARR